MRGDLLSMGLDITRILDNRTSAHFECTNILLRIRAREGRRRRLRRRRPDRARIRLSLTTRYSASSLLRCSAEAYVTQNGAPCKTSTVPAFAWLSNLMIVYVSAMLELVSKKDRMSKKDVPLKIWSTECSQLSLFSKSPVSYFWVFRSRVEFNFAHVSQSLTFFDKSCQDLWVEVKVETHLVGTHRVFLISDIFMFSRSWRTWYNHDAFEKTWSVNC